jgi:cation:H+ antiporter
LGSNIANIALILGITALITPLKVASETLRREYPMLLAATLVTTVLLLDGALSRLDGVILLTGLTVLLYGMVRIGLRGRATDPMEKEFDAELPEEMSTGAALLWFSVGLVLLLISSRMLVWGAVNIATAFGVSDLIIGLSIVALGTSLPELAAGVASALKGEHDIAIGNIIGSNMYNMLAVLAMPALFAPGEFLPEALTRDLPIMIGLTLALFVMGYGFGRPGRISRFEGLLLVLTFIGYQGLLFFHAQEARQAAHIPSHTVVLELAATENH